MMTTRKKRKTPGRAKDWSIAPILNEIIPKILKRAGLETRKVFNEEDAQILLNKGILYNKATVIRKDLKIPAINPKDDIRVYEVIDHKTGDTFDESESIFLYNNPDIKVRLDKEIDSLLKYFDVADNFREWLEYFILYNHIPAWNPSYGIFDLYLLLAAQSKIPKRNLITGEKKFLKSVVKKELGIIGGRPPKKSAKKYSLLLKRLAKSKNPRRRLKNPVESLGLLKGHSYSTMAKKTEGISSPSDIERLRLKKHRFSQRHPYLKVEK